MYSPKDKEDAFKNDFTSETMVVDIPDLSLCTVNQICITDEEAIVDFGSKKYNLKKLHSEETDMIMFRILDKEAKYYGITKSLAHYSTVGQTHSEKSSFYNEFDQIP